MHGALLIREIRWGSAEYEAELALRNEVLRNPLGRTLSEADVSGDAQDLHFGAFEEDRLVGCLLLKPLGDAVFRMRQVAVHPKRHGAGVGRALVAAAEARALELAANEIRLNARETAIPFYLKLGYEVFGGPVTQLSLPHRSMKKVWR